ncbi:RNA 2'-O ribose methyltransferase substrate binding family protein, partial [Chlamydia psittaci 08-2626_L3]
YCIYLTYLVCHFGSGIASHS